MSQSQLGFYLTPAIVIISIPIPITIFYQTLQILKEFKNTNLPLYNFLSNKWYIDEFTTYCSLKQLKILAHFFWKKGDLRNY